MKTIMTNASVKNLLFVLATFAVAAALSLGAFATTVQAEGWSDYNFGGDGWSDYNYDSWSDYNYDNYSDYNYDSWSDYNYDNYSDYNYDGWSDYNYDGWNDYSYTNDYELYNNDYERYNNDYELYNNDYELYNNDYEYVQEQGYFYQDSYASAPQYHSQPMAITPPRYNQPPAPVQPPRYTPPPVQPPRYTQPPAPPVQPPRYAPPVQQQPNITNVNTNTNTNTCTGTNNCNNTNTNIDNSINHSFNPISNYAPVYPVTPAPIIQYQFPPVQQGLYCVITVGQNNIHNSQAPYLSWTSYGAYSATLSDGIGQVAVNGSLAVRPNTTRTYVLTVYGQGGSANCSATVYVSGIAPSVSLSQIPYTGLDLGTFGSIAYWMSLLSFAIAGAYLVVYYKGGAFALATETVRSLRMPKMNFSATVEVQNVEEIVAAPSILEEKSEVNAFAGLPTMEDRSTKDSMTIARSHGGAPRIVINRG